MINKTTDDKLCIKKIEELSNLIIKTIHDYFEDEKGINYIFPILMSALSYLVAHCIDTAISDEAFDDKINVANAVTSDIYNLLKNKKSQKKI